jgi:hypothetical protein
MNDDFISLTKKQINFLMEKFDVKDPDTALERFVEYLVLKGESPMDLKNHLIRLMARENN